MPSSCTNSRKSGPCCEASRARRALPIAINWRTEHQRHRPAYLPAYLLAYIHRKQFCCSLLLSAVAQLAVRLRFIASRLYSHSPLVNQRIFGAVTHASHPFDLHSPARPGLEWVVCVEQKCRANLASRPPVRALGAYLTSPIPPWPLEGRRGQAPFPHCHLFRPKTRAQITVPRVVDKLIGLQGLCDSYSFALARTAVSVVSRIFSRGSVPDDVYIILSALLHGSMFVDMSKSSSSLPLIHQYRLYLDIPSSGIHFLRNS